MVSVIDSRTNAVIATVAVGVQPSSMAYNPANQLSYVTNWVVRAAASAFHKDPSQMRLWKERGVSP